jgi:hypothetical protein
MAYELISDRNLTEGPQTLLVYINDITNGIFITLFLAVIWLILSIGMYLRQCNEL